jgi:glycosyltransferase involved in cell wall biosynthesis
MNRCVAVIHQQISGRRRDHVMRKVVIGMPVWNGERFLSEAIESILGQTYGDLELVISDNGSNDTTAEICCTYARRDDRIRYIQQKTLVLP